MSKIKCPNPDHNDQNPSFHLYEGSGYCFSCGYYEKGEHEVKKKEPEDIKKTIAYIESLPIMYIRELWLHSEGNGFYIVWPDGSYYKKRTQNGRSRYIGPVGHKAPLFTFKMESRTVVVIEGELNCLSLKTAIPELQATLTSPGSASEMVKHLNEYLTIGDIFAIVVDKDAAGVAAGVELKRELLKRGKRVTLIACSKDINQMLQDGGKEEVQNWWNLEVQAGL